LNKFTYAHKCSLVSNTLINTHTYRERDTLTKREIERHFSHTCFTQAYTHTDRHTLHTHTHTHKDTHTHTLFYTSTHKDTQPHTYTLNTHI